MQNIGIVAQLIAKPGKENALENFLIQTRNHSWTDKSVQFCS